MAISKGNATINIHRDELLKLLIDGLRAQATIADSELIFLEGVWGHTVTNKELCSHTFRVTMFRNGAGPYDSTIYVVGLGQNYFLGTIDYKLKLESGG